jgi:hypothetical protein
VPERRTKAELVHARDHVRRIGETVRFEIEAVDAAGIGSIDPVGAGGEVEGADRLEVVLDLRLVVVLVAPDPRSERPARRQDRVTGDVVVALRHVERMVGGEEVKGEPGRRSRPRTEGDLDEVGRLRGDVEHPRVRRLDQDAPTARSDEEGNGDVRLVVGALDRGVELELHGAHGAAVIDAVEVLAETVEGLGGMTRRLKRKKAIAGWSPSGTRSSANLPCPSRRARSTARAPSS